MKDHALTLLKLGGSLLTDKSRPETDRPEVLARLAQEIAAAFPRLEEGLILGHGSGSFGHVAAEQYGIHRGLKEPRQRLGVAITQRQAAELHHRVIDALIEALRGADTAPYSIAPSSMFVTAGGQPISLEIRPLVRVLKAGLIPVLYGDLVMDWDCGCAIASTELVFRALAEALTQTGRRIRRILWLGETAGVWDTEGEIIPRITPATAEKRLDAVGGSAGTDVTGGMRHRVETALMLAREHGIASWIGDGREPGLLRRALEGEETERLPGTWVVPG